MPRQGRWKQGKGRPRHVPGVMNKTEEAYAAHLTLLRAAGEIVEFAFESIKLRLASNTWYNPDFFVQLRDGTLQAHEVKGVTHAKKVDGVRGDPKELWEDDARVKFKVAAEQHPWLQFCSVRRGTKEEGEGWVVTPL
jgi:hypothetical protein